MSRLGFQALRERVNWVSMMIDQFQKSSDVWNLERGPFLAKFELRKYKKEEVGCRSCGCFWAGWGHTGRSHTHTHTHSDGDFTELSSTQTVQTSVIPAAVQASTVSEYMFCLKLLSERMKIEWHAGNLHKRHFHLHYFSTVFWLSFFCGKVGDFSTWCALSWTWQSSVLWANSRSTDKPFWVSFSHFMF